MHQKEEMKLGLLILTLGFSLWGRPAEPENHLPHWRGVVQIGHTLIDAHHWNSHLMIPSIGFDLEYWPVRQFGVGLHSDMEIQSFVVQSVEGEGIQRVLPLVQTVDALWKPWKDLVLIAGPGLEFERTKSYALFRIGMEYEIEFGHHWDISPTLFYDNRFGHDYNTFSIALGIGKRF